MIEALNPQQRDVVLQDDGYALVLAGAGSGKTRVLIHRIAWLITTGKADPSSIIAVTFSNKAAAELKERLSCLLPENKKLFWIGTFHSLCHRILRKEAAAAGLSPLFQVIDSDDQLRLIKKLLKAHNLDETIWPPRQILHYILNRKEKGLAPGKALPLVVSAKQATWEKLYADYQIQCKQSDWVDFPDLILRTLRLWEEHPEILKGFQSRFRYLFVDEFQDTDDLQYQWMKQLAGSSTYIMAVGDDDQSIYGWRGAKVENLFRFVQDFPKAVTLRLEQNYRSTPEILGAANGLIGHNQGRFGKTLWSQTPSGEKISLYAASNERDEAYYVAQTIYAKQKQGTPLDQFAILYRNNAQSRPLEEALVRLQVPYRIYGGLRFFDRQEIKEALAYLRLALNPRDDAAFERILNLPPRGIGERSMETLREIAKERSCSLWEALRWATNPLSDQLSSKRSALVSFLLTLENLQKACAELPLKEAFRQLLTLSGLMAYYKNLAQKNTLTSASKLENLAELLSAAELFQAQWSDQERDPRTIASEFLAQVALDYAPIEQKPKEEGSSVQLMTIHASKGLEFEEVFIVGVEEGLFPSEGSSSDPKRLEEERRLAYVGITRARRRLTMTYAHKRLSYGRICSNSPSRFLHEIPSKFIKVSDAIHHLGRNLGGRIWNFEDSSTRESLEKSDESHAPIIPGLRVQHSTFGEGKVVKVEGAGENRKAHVEFPDVGLKLLLLRLAKLVPID